MKASDIKVGGVYLAKVSNKLTRVRVDAINEREGKSYPGVLGHRVRYRASTSYSITNLATGRQTTFRSTAKFRKAVS